MDEKWFTMMSHLASAGEWREFSTECHQAGSNGCLDAETSMRLVAIILPHVTTENPNPPLWALHDVARDYALFKNSNHTGARKVHRLPGEHPLF